MSGMRGRAIRQGQMVTDAGASARTTPGSNLLRPAYTYQGGTPQPAGVGGAGGDHAEFFDLSNVASWRLIFFLAAVGYIIGFHTSLGRVRVGIGPAGG